MEISEKTQAAAARVLGYIEAHPEHHNQKYWFNVAGSDEETDLEKTEQVIDFNACGTTMCIAGTATWMSRGMPKLLKLGDINSEYEGAEFLDLDFNEAHELFYTTRDDTALHLLEALADGDAERYQRVLDTEERYADD